MMFDFAYMFMSPEARARIDRQEKAMTQRVVDNAVDWDEDKTKFAPYLGLRGSTYDTSRYRLFDSKPATKSHLTCRREGIDGLKNVVRSPNDTFVYANRVLPAQTRLALAQGDKRGWVAFDEKIVVPVLFEWKEGSLEPLQVWMGITPMEMLTCRAGIRKATGTVLIGGLGLGWMLWKVAEKKSVKKIIVVEKSQELLDWYGNDLCKRISDEYNKPIEVICDDVLNHMGKHGKDVRHLIDIWPDYPNHRCFLPKEWRAAINRVRYFWGWGVFELQERSRW